jgi:TonB-linked SusC/RagA family outer membrane protein
VTPYQSYLGDKPTIDWQNPFLTNNAVNMDASAKVYGGTENTNYYVSLGYSQIEAPIKTNEQDRFTLSTNINSKVAKWMEVGLTNRLAYVDIVDRTGEGTGTDNASAPPWQPLLLEDDYYQINSPVEDLGYATVQDSITDTSTDPYGVTWLSKYGEPSAVNMNSLAFQDPALYNNEYRIIRNLANAYLKLKIYKGLSIKGSLSLDYYHNRREWWHSVDQAFFVQTPGNPHATGSGASLGSITYRDKYDHNFIKELVLDWIESFGDHNINITLSAMDQQYGFKFIQTGTSEVQQEDPDKRYIRENQEYTTVGEWIDNSALQGYMARASYNYASKYYVDATVRRDGSSKFAPDYRWGTFPSFALAWRMSAENFMSGVTWLNDLKWRAGWGQLGNQETASFAWLSGVSRAPQYAYGSGLGDAYGNNVNGLFLPDFPNEELSWETSTTLNIGFDAIFFKNRFTATVEWYDRLTEDILQPSALPYSVGNYNNPILNIASVRNRGWEFQLGWRDVAGDFQYFINGNLTTVHNEVMEVWNDQPFGDESARIEKGYPLNYLWGFQVDGIYQSDEEVTNWWNTYSDSQADPALVSEGDMYFKDVHGPPNKDEGYDFYTPYPDSVVDLNDRAYIGSTIPGLYYGLNLGVSWKGIDLTLFFQGIGDVSKVNNARWGGTGMQSRGVNQWTDVENRWTPDNKNQWDPNDKAGSLPRAVLNDPGANTRFSDRWVESGSFMRLRNLTLGYNLPSKWMNNTDYIERCRFYISGMNLWTITNWTGIDPENDDIPIPVTWSFGVNATF